MLAVAVARAASVLQVALRRLLALDRGLISAGCGALALLGLANAFLAFELACLSRAFSLIGEPFAEIGSLLARVGFLISLTGDSLARTRRRLAAADALLPDDQLRFAHLKLDLAALDVYVPLLDAPMSRRPIIACDRVASSVASNQICPAAFQGRAGALVRRRVAMQLRSRTVALLLPERCRSLMRLGSTLMASFGLLVTAR